MQVSLGRRPFPHTDYNVPLDTLGPLRLRGRQLAGGDAIGPVREQRQSFLGTELVESGQHVRLCLTRL